MPHASFHGVAFSVAIVIVPYPRKISIAFFLRVIYELMK